MLGYMTLFKYEDFTLTNELTFHWWVGNSFQE